MRGYVASHHAGKDWGLSHDYKADYVQIPITVKALRPNASGGPAETVQMQLTPRRNWGGRGLLGCHLLPM